MPLDEIIRKHALRNAYDYGKANPGAVAGKVIAEFPDAKKDMKTAMGKISAAVKEVNALGKEKIEAELKKYSFAEKPKEKKGLEVPNAAQGKVVTRFPPEPSGYPHIGHAKAAFLDYELAKQYGGRMILRFDDTNPEKESQEYVEAIKEGLRWLGILWSRETYTSDNVPLFYQHCEKMLKEGKAYVCSCSQEEISGLRAKMKACPCRGLKPGENITRWKDMLSGKTKAGGAIVRFKGDLASQNTVMRDPALFRIIEAQHYRQGKKYRVWPTYDFEAPIMDAIEGITHPMRSKEYELRDELYFAIIGALSLPKPTLVEFSRLSIKGMPISKRLITPLVKEGKVLGWDDPRLPTLKGFARRGVLPEAIRNFVLSFGLSKVESEPTLENLLVENRKMLDSVSKHYFFVPEPVKLTIKGAEKKAVSLKMLPKSADSPVRAMSVGDVVYIPKKDLAGIKEGETFRLKDLYNVKLVKKGKAAVAEYSGDGMVEKKIQWVPESYIECEVLVPKELVDREGNYIEASLETVKGFAEESCKELNDGDIIQFERFGFCKMDKRGSKLTFVLCC